MAFTGTFAAQMISDRVARVTGVSLAAGASGIIGLFGGAVVGANALPRQFKPEPYRYGTANVEVTLIESIRVTINPVTDVANFAIPIRVVKSGAGVAAFQIALTNDEAAVASPELEIYVEFLG